MEDSYCENMSFALLIEQNKAILEKSQNSDVKKKKEEAITNIIKKWKETSGKELTHAALLKKVNNFKLRSKAAFNNGKKLRKWQTKILELIKDTDDAVDPKFIPAPSCDDEGEHKLLASELEAENSRKSLTDYAMRNKSISPSSSGNKAENKLLATDKSAEEIVNSFETPETKLLTNEQLQRIVLLQQTKVLQLQRNKLEREMEATTTGNGVIYEFEGWDGPSVVNVNKL